MNPQTHALLMQILQAILSSLLPFIGTLVGSLLSYALWHLIGLIKNQKLQQEAATVVAFAEQKLVNSDAKRTYVLNFLMSKGLSQQDAEHLLEAAVLALNRNQAVAAAITSSASGLTDSSASAQ
jgi:hypothetical protein